MSVKHKAYDDDKKDKIRSVIHEHYDNFAFIVLEDDGDVYFDYTNAVIGKALMAEGLKSMITLTKNYEIVWDDDTTTEEEDE